MPDLFSKCPGADEALVSQFLRLQSDALSSIPFDVGASRGKKLLASKASPSEAAIAALQYLEQFRDDQFEPTRFGGKRCLGPSLACAFLALRGGRKPVEALRALYMLKPVAVLLAKRSVSFEKWEAASNSTLVATWCYSDGYWSEYASETLLRNAFNGLKAALQSWGNHPSAGTIRAASAAMRTTRRYFPDMYDRLIRECWEIQRQRVRGVMAVEPGLEAFTERLLQRLNRPNGWLVALGLLASLVLILMFIVWLW